MNKCLALMVVALILEAGAVPHWSWRQANNPYNYLQNSRPMTYVQGYPVNNQNQRSNLPSVEIQQVTAEWMCNNLATGAVKFFGVRDVQETKMSPEDVEKLLNQGPPTAQVNHRPTYKTVPVPGTTPHDLPPIFADDDKPLQTTQKPNYGEGMIDIRTGE